LLYSRTTELTNSTEKSLFKKIAVAHLVKKFLLKKDIENGAEEGRNRGKDRNEVDCIRGFR
jgi:hypothetical protein